MPRRAVVYVIVAMISWLVAPILTDLTVLCLVALSGEMVDYILIKRLIKRCEEALLIDKAADETSARVAAQVDNLMKSYTGRV